MGDELQARIRVRELQNTGNNSCVSCLGWRWHRGKTVFMPRCSSAQRSVASAWREKRKQVVSRVRGICDDVTMPVLHSGVVQILKAGQVHTNDPFCCPNSPLQSSYIWFAGWPKPYSYRRAQNRLNNSRVKLCHVRLWQVELFQLTKKVHSLLGLFHDGVDVSVPLQVLSGPEVDIYLYNKYIHIYYVYINTHTYSIYLENIYMFIHLYIHILIFYIIYKYI